MSAGVLDFNSLLLRFGFDEVFDGAIFSSIINAPIQLNTQVFKVTNQKGFLSGQVEQTVFLNTGEAYIRIYNNNVWNPWVQIAGGGGGGGVTSIKVGATGTPRTGDITLIAGTNETIIDNNDNSITFNSAGGGGGSSASFSYNPAGGNVPLSVTLSDTSNPSSDSRAWNIAPTTYTITAGTLTSSNLTITLNQATQYTITMTPTKAGTTYNPAMATAQITPTVLNGDFTLVTTQSPRNTKTVNYRLWQNSDLIIMQLGLVNTQQCSSVTSATISVSNNSTLPLQPTVTASQINAGSAVSTPTIAERPRFIDANNNLGVTFTTTIVAVMNNSDGTTTSKTHADTISYYVPAYKFQNNTNTPPAIDSVGIEVVTTNYTAGQSLTMNTTDGNWMWVAVPLNITTLNLYSLSLGQISTNTPDVVAPQVTISQVVYSLFGYNIRNLPANLLLTIGQVPTQAQIAHSLTQSLTQEKKTGFFTKILNKIRGR